MYSVPPSHAMWSVYEYNQCTIGLGQFYGRGWMGCVLCIEYKVHLEQWHACESNIMMIMICTQLIKLSWELQMKNPLRWSFRVFFLRSVFVSPFDFNHSSMPHTHIVYLLMAALFQQKDPCLQKKVCFFQTLRVGAFQYKLATFQQLVVSSIRLTFKYTKLLRRSAFCLQTLLSLSLCMCNVCFVFFALLFGFVLVYKLIEFLQSRRLNYVRLTNADFLFLNFCSNPLYNGAIITTITTIHTALGWDCRKQLLQLLSQVPHVYF